MRPVWTTILECWQCEGKFTHTQEEAMNGWPVTQYRSCPHCGANEDSKRHSHDASRVAGGVQAWEEVPA